MPSVETYRIFTRQFEGLGLRYMVTGSLAGQDRLHRWALERAEVVQLDQDTVRFDPPEYVIVRKLEYFREGRSEKHLRDIRGMLDCLGPDWNQATLSDLISSRGLQAEWSQVVGGGPAPTR